MVMQIYQKIAILVKQGFYIYPKGNIERLVIAE